jgi:hypothetical protein
MAKKLNKAERIVKNWDIGYIGIIDDKIIKMKEPKRYGEQPKQQPIRWSVKLGFNFLLLSWIAVVWLFIKAFLSPARAVTIYVNNYNEMAIEIILLAISAIFIYKFVVECISKGILRFRWQR